MRYRLIKKYKIINIATPYLFMLPAFAIYLLIVLYPIIYTVILSFYEWDGISEIKEFVGIANYKYIFLKDQIFYVALFNNIKWTIVSVILPIGIGLFFAVLLNSKLKGSSFYRSVIFFPTTLSLVIVGLIWFWIYNPAVGLVNNILNIMSSGRLSFDWFANPSLVIFFIVIAGSWSYTGIVMVMFMAGLQAIPKVIYEAAEIDGANNFRTFLHITIPQLKNTFNIVLVLTLISSFKVFDLVMVMSRGGPGRASNVLATWSYSNMFQYFNWGKGSALALILTIFVLGFSVLSTYLSREK